MKNQTKSNTWVLRIIHQHRFQYLYETGGNWGPSSLPTYDIREATRYSSKQDAIASECARCWGDNVEPVEYELQTLALKAEY
jgi:hypothetical protein